MTGRLDLVAAYLSGDLAWQQDPTRPPACRFPGRRPSPFELAEHAALWDAHPRGRIPPDVWERINRARKVCADCPLRMDCLIYALDPANRVEGVWGGEYFAASGVRRRLNRQGLRLPLGRPPDWQPAA